MKTVIFDLDGTLADTSGDLIAAANACFREMGHGDVLDPVVDAETAFHGGRAMLTLGLTRLGHGDVAAEVERWYHSLLRHYEAAIDVHTTLYPGTMEAVRALKAAGYKVGICTNKPAGLAETLMTRLGVRGEFASLVGADTLPVRKPDPAPLVAAATRAGGDPKQCVLIGDTVTDRKTAAALGVPCILVTFGPSGRGVEALQPEGLIDHYDGLLAEVVRLLGTSEVPA
ncbi:HAD-IA family hydrolase [Thalassobius sp. Cn5-15]|uniref:HAD-IA family hydrolase n=1 Tax=Thalassobius sp. Cn5-15 TaxID=2917763 RepID=UPI001EF3A058|nr:HAD-IA family hydrolase [Thalassobius sp. Cn5-15]MCG7494739.1 HAD-IA family hydrolase [Thalassobius sp. Cn5-15]